MNMVFLGPPGAGKGTQAAKVASRLSIPHISTGAMLREAIAAGTELGLKAKSVMDAGGLVSDEIVIGIVKERLSAEDCADGYILDGFPRTIPQAEALDSFSAIDAAVNVDVPAERIIERISQRLMCRGCGEIFIASRLENTAVCPKCGKELYQRDDDKPETVKRRLEAYEAQTKPLVDFYKAKGALKNIDGDRDIEEVYSSIMEVLLKDMK